MASDSTTQSGRYSFARAVVEGGLWFSGSSAAVKAVGIANTILVLRLLSVYEYGLYHLVLAAYGLASVFFLSGFDQIVLADLMRAKGEGDPGRARRIFSEFFLLKAGIGAALFFAVFFGARAVGSWYGADIAHLVRIISLLFLLVPLERAMNMVFNYHLSFRAMSLYTLTEEALKLVALLFFIFVAGMGVSGVVLAVVSASAGAFVVFLPRAVRLFGAIPVPIPVPMRQESGRGPAFLLVSAFSDYGKWAVGFRYLGDFQRHLRPWLIRFFLSTEAVGIFAIAENMYGQVVGLVPLVNVFVPAVAQHIADRTGIRKLLYVCVKYGTPFFVILGIASVPALWVLIYAVFPQYAEALPVFYIFLLTAFTAGVSNILMAVFYAERRQRAHFFIMASTVAVTLIFGILLIPAFGVAGIAMEFVISAFFFNGARLWYLFRRYPELRFAPRLLFSFGAEDKALLRSALSNARGLIFRNAPRA